MATSDQTLDVGRRLAAARMRRDLSQATVARLSGFAPSYISRIETGKVHPTFRTVQRIAEAIRIPFSEIAATGSVRPDNRAGCPVTAGGMCLLDLIRSEADVERGTNGEFFSPRQIKLIRRFAGWLRAAKPDRLRAMELLLDDLIRGAAPPEGRSSTDRRTAPAPQRFAGAQGPPK